MRVAEEHAFLGETVQIRGAEQAVRAGQITMIGVDAREAAPVVGEEEEDVRALRRRLGERRRSEEQGEDGEEAHGQRAGLIGLGSKSVLLTQLASTGSPLR